MTRYKATDAQRRLQALIGSKAQNVMAFGGSRSGKTFEFCRSIIQMALVAKGRYAICRKQFNTVKNAVFNETLPEVLDICFSKNGIVPTLNKSGLYYELPGGSKIFGLGLDDAKRVEKVLGRGFLLLYFNECSEISYHAIETAKTRLAQNNHLLRPRIFYDCNPPLRSHWTYKLFIEHKNPVTNIEISDPDNYASIRINPKDNVENLRQEYIKVLEEMSPEKKKRYYYGEWTDDNENALWKQSTMIDAFRITEAPDELERVVVGVDPAVTSNKKSDRTGIVICGMKTDWKTGQRHYYVLDDYSAVMTPHDWAIRVKSAYERFDADKIVAEVNQGGDLVAENLRNVAPTIPVATVRASRGKVVRAEPIATLYQRGLVHHVGEFPDLEMEMTSYTGAVTDDSPDRMDALVWALWELSRGENEIDFGNLGSYV